MTPPSTRWWSRPVRVRGRERGAIPAAGGPAGNGVWIAALAVAALVVVGALTAPMVIVGGSGMLVVAGACQGAGAPSAAPGGAAPQPAPSEQARQTIPPDYLALYQRIGRQYGVPWVILAGIGTEESDNGQSNLPGVHSGTNSAGAAGPMQIGVGGAAGDTWRSVATDEDGAGPPSVYDPADAIAGAAKYLLEHGVRSDPAAAIFAYNHAPWYVQAVERDAAEYAAVAGMATVTGSQGATADVTGGCGSGNGLAVGGAPNQAAATAISYARQQIGKPYLWGGTGPDAFDCSGLVMMAYRAAGIAIPRTSQQQWAWGPRIPPGHEEPGDLVFFAGSDGTPSAPGHVGLVIGNGQMIEAYAPGYPIRITSYGTPQSPPGDRHPVGFTRPWAHAGVSPFTVPGGA